jgi:hypothetical protein
MSFATPKFVEKVVGAPKESAPALHSETIRAVTVAPAAPQLTVMKIALAVFLGNVFTGAVAALVYALTR